jgi:AcrR family transcriptional regulator
VNVKRISPRRRLTRTESQAQTKARLIEAGTGVFARRGYYEATIEEIAESAGYSRGAFYANFADKAELLLTAMDIERDREFAELRHVLDRIDKEGEVLPAMYRWFSKNLSTQLDRASAEFQLAAADSPSYRRRLAKAKAAARDLTAELVERYCRRHDVQLRVDYTTFATMVGAAVDGFANQLRLDPSSVPPETIGLALTALWDGMVT